MGSQIDSKFEDVPISYFAKVYKFNMPLEKMKTQKDNLPTKMSQTYHFNELEYMEKPLQAH